jgi:hypothetical protein
MQSAISQSQNHEIPNQYWYWLVIKFQKPFQLLELATMTPNKSKHLYQPIIKSKNFLKPKIRCSPLLLHNKTETKLTDHAGPGW